MKNFPVKIFIASTLMSGLILFLIFVHFLFFDDLRYAAETIFKDPAYTFGLAGAGVVVGLFISWVFHNRTKDS